MINIQANQYPTTKNIDPCEPGNWGPGFRVSKLFTSGRGDGHEHDDILFEPRRGNGRSSPSKLYMDETSDLATLAILAVNQGMRL